MEYPCEGWHNKVGTSDRDAPEGSWKKRWEEKSELEWPALCMIKECNAIPTDGSHMYCPAVDKKEWIIPTCHYHNMHKGEYELKSTYYKIRANINDET